MASFLQTLYPYGHLTIAIIELILLLFAYPFFRLSNNWAMIVLPIVLVSTIYDNLILWLGNWIGEGQLLENLSQVRFLLHYLAVPLLIVVAIELAYRSEAKWANKFSRISSWLLAFGLAGYDIFNNFIGLQLKPELFDNVLLYVSVSSQLSVITIIINIFVLLVGIGIWVRTKKWQWLFVGASIGMVGNAFPVSQAGTLPGSATEMILSLSLLLTQYHLEDDEEEEEEEESIVPPEGWHVAEYAGYRIFWKSEERYTIYQTGEHQDGDFIRIYAPKQPWKKDGKAQVITYLHGFALSMPQFYQRHLEQLANDGYYVFFPDYQRSDYPNFPDDDATCEDKMTADATVKYGVFGTGVLLIQLLLGRKVNQKELKNLAKQGILTALRLVIGRLFFIIFVNVFYVFDRQYGKNLISMITTVIASLTDTPMKWLDFAVQTTATAWEKLSEYSKQKEAEGKQEEAMGLQICQGEEQIDFYVFGHSLGGLLALSWCYYLQQNPEPKLDRFVPKQILTGDPAPSTELGIPAIALWFLRIFRFPFATEPLKIEQTGKELNLPVGILHGNDDKIVKPTQWVVPPASEQKGAFFHIVSQHKKIYFSLSNPNKNLTANHNQSVTNTSYYADDFMENFGGAKDKPNAYNYQYIWSALTGIIADGLAVDNLANGHGFDLKDFTVNDDEPILHRRK